jgi:Tfp pilus assembly protein PilO
VDKIIIKIAELSWPKIFLAGLIFAGAYYAFFYESGENLKKEQEHLQQQQGDLERLLKITKEKVSNADRFEKEVSDLVEQFNRTADLMPAKMNSAELTTIASDLVSKAGAHLVRTEPRIGGPKGEFYDTTGLSLSIEGSFSQIEMFLSYLSRVPKLLTFEKVDINAAKSADVESPTLLFNGVLVGYRSVAVAPLPSASLVPGPQGTLPPKADGGKK